MLVRPSKQEVDEEILDAAAGLLAQHGYRQTSVQAVADAVGYSKAGLLHRFPTKEALLAAAVEQCRTQVRALLAGVEDLPPGPDRDLAALTATAHLAQRRPGSVALILPSATAYDVTAHDASGLDAQLAPVGDDLLAAFAVLPGCEDHRRVLAVSGALGALAVTTLALRAASPGGVDPTLLQHVVATSFNALGHPAAPDPSAPAERDL